MSSTPSVISVAEPAAPSASKPPFQESALIGAVLAVTALMYAWTLTFPFVYDDHPQIVENQLVHFWRYVPGYFRGFVWQYLLPKISPNYYRPVNFVWFRLNDALFGLHPAAWHATTVLLHLLATLLAYRVARRITGRPLVAAVTALAFGIHPMRHEVVAWISGTTESLWSVFFFAAFLAYLRSREAGRGRWLTTSCACYAVGLLCKESMIVLPAIVFAHAWLYGSDSAAGTSPRISERVVKATKPALLYVPLAAAYFALRVHVLGAFSQPIEPFSWRTLLFTLPSVAWFYMHQWLLPVRMSEFYPLDLRTKFDMAHVLIPLLALAVLSATLWFARKRLGQREVAFALVWMIAPLLPALDVVVFPLGQTVHDRYFYLPSFGASLLLALALDRLSNSVPATLGLPRRWLLASVVLLALLACGTVSATSYWASDYAMLNHAAQFAPGDPILRSYYAPELERQGWLAYERGNWPAAEDYLQRSRENDPEVAGTHFELGLVDLEMNRIPQAQAHFQDAAGLGPNEPAYHFFLGLVLARQGKCGDSRSQFASALALSPGFKQAQQLMDNCARAAQSDPPRVRRSPATASSTP